MQSIHSNPHLEYEGSEYTCCTRNGYFKFVYDGAESMFMFMTDRADQFDQSECKSEYTPDYIGIFIQNGPTDAQSDRPDPERRARDFYTEHEQYADWIDQFIYDRWTVYVVSNPMKELYDLLLSESPDQNVIQNVIQKGFMLMSSLGGMMRSFVALCAAHNVYFTDVISNLHTDRAAAQMAYDLMLKYKKYEAMNRLMLEIWTERPEPPPPLIGPPYDETMLNIYLDFAASTSDFELLRFVLQNGGDSNGGFRRGSALVYSVAKNRMDMTRTLIQDYNADPNIRVKVYPQIITNRQGATLVSSYEQDIRQTPLEQAVIYSHRLYDMCEYLLKTGKVDVGARQNQALMWAAIMSDLKTIQLLIGFGANFRDRNDEALYLLSTFDSDMPSETDNHEAVSYFIKLYQSIHKNRNLDIWWSTQRAHGGQSIMEEISKNIPVAKLRTIHVLLNNGMMPQWHNVALRCVDANTRPSLYTLKSIINKLNDRENATYIQHDRAKIHQLIETGLHKIIFIPSSQNTIINDWIDIMWSLLEMAGADTTDTLRSIDENIIKAVANRLIALHAVRNITPTLDLLKKLVILYDNPAKLISSLELASSQIAYIKPAITLISLGIKTNQHAAKVCQNIIDARRTDDLEHLMYLMPVRARQAGSDSLSRLYENELTRLCNLYLASDDAADKNILNNMVNIMIRVGRVSQIACPNQYFMEQMNINIQMKQHLQSKLKQLPEMVSEYITMPTTSPANITHLSLQVSPEASPEATPSATPSVSPESTPKPPKPPKTV